MAYYIKVTKQVHQAMNVNGRRNKTADRNILLWQSDMIPVPGFTLDDKVKYVGGAKLSPQEAKAETDGTDNPAYVYTPEVYGGEEEEKKDAAEETPDGGGEDATDSSADGMPDPDGETETTEGGTKGEEA